MSFAAPNFLWLLPIVLGPLLIFYWWAWRRRQQLITQFISSRLLAQLKVGVSAARQKARMAMMVTAVICLILALARPQWGVTSEEAHQRGLDIVVAIDTSRSMLAEDVPPNRLARAKLAAIDLVRRAKTDRLGLVAFAGTAFLQCPLTLDDAAFSQSVDALDTQTLSQGGTAIAEAIGEAAKAFKHDGDNHKVLVLFTDGEDHDSEAVAAAEKAAKDGMVIFTVGIGSPEGDVLRIRDARGRVEPIRDQSGQPVKSRLNEDLLRQIAVAAHGFYLPLRGARTMDTLYEQGLAPLPQTDTATRMFQRYHERFYWPLGIAMACLILEMFYPDRKHARRRPAASAGQPGALEKLASTTALLLLLLGWPAAAQAGGGASSALREYNQGNFDQALRDYNQLLERKQDDPRLHFNAGAAAYQSRKPDEAVKQFQEALKSPDLLLQQRSYYNLANSLYRLGEQDQDTKKKQKAWETALQQYTNALALNKLDPDAKFNRDFVEQQLEVLKKQQSQSNKDDQKQDDKKDDKKGDQRDGSNSKNDQKQDQQKQDQQKQDSQAQNEKDQKSGDEKQKQDQSKGDQQDKKEDGKKDTAQQQDSGKSDEDKKKEEAEQEAAMMAAGQMTPTQAQQLLDAQKGEEQVLHLAPSTEKQSNQGRPLKDW